MKVMTVLAGTAIASFAMFSDLGAHVGLSVIPAAEAATSVSFSVFYDGLAHHGDWVRHRDNYVFIPANVRSGWRPYTDGHWVYTNQYGWTWASEEPFGWATYHYGRWGYGDDIGWYWVPGKRWAPAWVSWRRSNDHVVWAPLPPSGGDDVDVSVSVNVGSIPDFYWVAVPTRRFLEPNLRVVIIDNDRERRRVVQRAEPIGTVRVRNNIVINNVIDIDIVERETGRKVRRVEARRTNDPREARASDNQVTVFEGEVTRDEKTKPPRVREVSEVRKVRRDRNAENADTDANPDANSRVEAPEENAETAAPANETGTAKRKQRTNSEANTENAPADADNTQRTGTARKRPAQADTAEEPGNATTAQERRKAVQDRRKTVEERQKAVQDKKRENAARKDNAGQEPAAQQARKKRAKDAGVDEQDATGSTSRPADRAQKRKERAGKKDKNCDPATSPDCQPN